MTFEEYRKAVTAQIKAHDLKVFPEKEVDENKNTCVKMLTQGC